MRSLYLEDFEAGQTFASGRVRLTAEEIKRFAAEYDPQPFHLDDEAARHSFFGALAASGWHTAALTMRLLVDSDFKPHGGLIGARIEELRWPRAVRPEDELRLESTIVEVRPSRSRPGEGWVKARITTFNQRDEPVQIFTVNMIVPRRPSATTVSPDG